MKIFIVDFSAKNTIANVLSSIDNVDFIENTDDGRAYTFIGNFFPDYILINMHTKTKLGLETAKVIKARKKIQHIPLLFIADNQNFIDEVKDLGEIMNSNQLLMVLKNRLTEQ